MGPRIKWGTTARAVALGLVALLATACASFPVKRLPKAHLTPNQERSANKPSVYVPLRYMFLPSGAETPPGQEVSSGARIISNSRTPLSGAPLPSLQQIVAKIAPEAALFRTVTFESFQAREVDYVLQIDVFNYGSVWKAIGAGLITGLTLFMVPAAVTENFKLTAKLFDAGGQLLGTYSYDDAVTTWTAVWLLPAAVAGNTVESAVRGVCENMMRALFRDLAKDDLLRSKVQGPQSEPSSPAGVASARG